MIAAKTKSRPRSETRLLTVTKKDGSYTIEHLNFSDLPSVLDPGDLLVINDAATVPASFSGTHLSTGKPIEMRLGSSRSQDLKDPRRWFAVFFGEGDWRTRTELRQAAPPLRTGDTIQFTEDLSCEILELSGPNQGAAVIEFLGPSETLWSGIYRAGRPIQYSHLIEELEQWDVQTIFAGAPVALEAPSASFPMSWRLLFELEQKGVQVVAVTHAAGISTTGDSELDRSLPFPERYLISAQAALAVNRAHSERRRVIAVGTSVTRALESAAGEDGVVREGVGTASLVLTLSYRRKIVDGIISGFHESGASHLRLLGSFLPPAQLEEVYGSAEKEGYLCHEFGDVCLIK